VDLLAAKNLPAANISGTADPYAIISCGTERRFSSVIPSSRNPMWAEEFRFFAPCLPALVSLLHCLCFYVEIAFENSQKRFFAPCLPAPVSPLKEILCLHHLRFLTPCLPAL
ncbi:unnamed protein product, partial [Closterium sp. NIES-54]